MVPHEHGGVTLIAGFTLLRIVYLLPCSPAIDGWWCLHTPQKLDAGEAHSDENIPRGVDEA